MTMSTAVLEKRRRQVATVANGKAVIDCAKPSLAGSVSQRACVFCGSRVVLYPIVDAVHLVHGPAGCAAYTWDIRGTVSSGPELHRLCFTTDLREKDVIFGGLKSGGPSACDRTYSPPRVRYSTCIVGVIGDDVDGVLQKSVAEAGHSVIPALRGHPRLRKTVRGQCDALAS
jgi:nitrogenase molybdenum-cofactor synthesis protein NifE